MVGLREALFLKISLFFKFFFSVVQSRVTGAPAILFRGPGGFQLESGSRIGEGG